LQVGDPSWEITGILLALNPSPEALEEARRRQANLVITHHPLLFKPLKQISIRNQVSQTINLSLTAQTAVFCAHTNWDGVWGGVNDTLAGLLDIKVEGCLEEGPLERMCKVVVFTPSEAVDSVREALFDADTGVIGRYTHCSFASPGQGSFFGEEGSNPAVGVRGRVETADEARLEVIAPRSAVSQLLSRIKSVHPYEEVAYDVYPLLNPTRRGGMGRYGTLNTPRNLGELLKLIKDALELETIKYVGDPERNIRTVALCGGAGSSLWRKALQTGADVYISGEFRYHEALEAHSEGLALVDTGHFASEFPAMKALLQRIELGFAEREKIKISLFDAEKDIFEYS